MSCTDAGDCLAGGDYVDSSGAQQTMVASETNGSWGQAGELTLPANAIATAGSQLAGIGGVSCTSAGDCVAGGSYVDSSPATQAVVVSSVGSLSVASASLPSGMVGSAYQAQLSAAGGAGSYTWPLVSGSLPPGLTLSSSGVVSGTPAAAGTQSFEVQVGDPGPPAQQATGTVSMTVNPPAALTPTLMPSTRTTVATFGNRRITLTIPSGCVAPSSELAVEFASTKRSEGAKLRFESIGFYLDRGVKHKVAKRVGGKRKLVTVYLANATLRRQPVSLKLSVAKLRPGTNTLKVVVRYTKIIRNHGQKKRVTVTKTLRVNFSVC